jgi:hypothetical protein
MHGSPSFTQTHVQHAQHVQNVLTQTHVQHHPELCELRDGRFCNTVLVGVRMLATFGKISGDALAKTSCALNK